MPDIRLSIIVPFYNVEPYIEQCIRSLYNQDIPLEEYEVICVDDCSPDRSRAIVERLQSDYPTLKLIVHKENKCQGGARNTGLLHARGRYIWFVDSDDYIVPNCLSVLLANAEENQLEVLKFDFRKEPTDNNCRKFFYSPVVPGSELIFDIDTGEILLQKCDSVTHLLINANYIKEHQFKFAEHVQYEDDDYAYQIYAYSSRAMITPEVVYVNRFNPSSTTHRKNDIRRANDMYLQLLRMIELEPKLVNEDVRWGQVIRQYIKYSINDEIFIILKDCSLLEQISFWLKTTKKRELKTYLSLRSYLKLCSWIFWKIL